MIELGAMFSPGTTGEPFVAICSRFVHCVYFMNHPTQLLQLSIHMDTGNVFVSYCMLGLPLRIERPRARKNVAYALRWPCFILFLIDWPQHYPQAFPILLHNSHCNNVAASTRGREFGARPCFDKGLAETALCRVAYLSSTTSSVPRCPTWVRE